MDVSVASDHTFYVDMNSLRDDRVGTLLTLARNSVAAQMSPPSAGDFVTVYDDEDEYYLARVEKVEGNWVGVTILWDTPIAASEDFSRPSATGFSMSFEQRESATLGALSAYAGRS